MDKKSIVHFLRAGRQSWRFALFFYGFLPLILSLALPLLARAEETEEVKGLPQFAVDTFPSQLFWLVLTFGIFFFLMARVFAPKVEKKLAYRKNILTSDQKTAEQLLEQAKATEEKLAVAIARAKASARAELTTLNQKMTEQRDAALQKFQARADNAIKQKANELMGVQKKLMAEKEKMVTNIATMIHHKILDEGF